MLAENYPEEELPEKVGFAKGRELRNLKTSAEVPSPCHSEAVRKKEGRRFLFLPYVKRTVKAGSVIETKKYFNARVHTPFAKRAHNSRDTEKAQRKCNERKAAEELRWILNATFKEGDLHVVCHYGDKPQDFEKVESDTLKMCEVLRNEYKKAGEVLKRVAVIETKRMTNPHIHLVVNKIEPEIIIRAWRKVSGKGFISFEPLDDRGNHKELADYLIKESKSTARRWKEGKKHKKRYWCSRNVVRPEPVYEVIPAKNWKKEPKARKGYFLFKDKEGIAVHEGFHE
ncbi:MAG: hypothetical protein IKK14_08975, partial [Oscillospiraceae bacterium]|nr:hypothetical protein [Oscillospiraceae bacterium]